MRYRFIREHQHEFSVERMCRVLDVTRSGYYAWRPEKTGLRQQENQILVEQIWKEYKTSRQTYGSPRIWAALLNRAYLAGATV
jgi:putative transposase